MVTDSRDSVSIIEEKYKFCEDLLNVFFVLSGYCQSTHCPVGSRENCCSSEMRLNEQYCLFEELDILIQARIREFGKPYDNGEICGYMQDEGCIAKNYRNPRCISYLCDEHKKYLKDEFGISYNNETISSGLELILTGLFRGELYNSYKKKIEELLDIIKNQNKEE